MFKLINKVIVFTVTLSSVYLFSDNIINFIEPYIYNKYIGIVQLFTFGFCVGYVNAMVVDNFIKWSMFCYTIITIKI